MGYGARAMAAGPALAKSFELSDIPFDLSLREPLHILPSGELVYVLAGENAGEAVAEQVATLTDSDPAPGVESDEEPVADSDTETDTDADAKGEAESGEKSNSDWTPVDWTLAKPTTEGGPPSEVFLVNYPWKQANSVISSNFQRVQWKELKYIESKGGRTAVDGGKLTWNGYAADYVLEREFRPGLRFQDRLRVNLTVNSECWVAYAVWPEQEAGSKEPAAEILAALRPNKAPAAEL
jgi:hypothetical protein